MTPGAQPLAVVAQGQAGDRVCMPAQRPCLLGRFQIPNLDSGVVTSRVEPLAIAAQHQAGDDLRGDAAVLAEGRGTQGGVDTAGRATGQVRR
jgi:hypothetical protein